MGRAVCPGRRPKTADCRQATSDVADTLMGATDKRKSCLAVNPFAAQSGQRKSTTRVGARIGDGARWAGKHTQNAAC